METAGVLTLVEKSQQTEPPVTNKGKGTPAAIPPSVPFLFVNSFLVRVPEYRQCGTIRKNHIPCFDGGVRCLHIHHTAVDHKIP